MKKLFPVIIFIGLSLISFGQSQTSAVGPSKAAIGQAKRDGIFNFILPEGTTPEKVAENSKYYTLYFKVNYNADSREASVVMATNDEKSRHVICRFLVASGVEKVNADAISYSVEDYYVAFLK